MMNKVTELRSMFETKTMQNTPNRSASTGKMDLNQEIKSKPLNAEAPPFYPKQAHLDEIAKDNEKSGKDEIVRLPSKRAHPEDRRSQIKKTTLSSSQPNLATPEPSSQETDHFEELDQIEKKFKTLIPQIIFFKQVQNGLQFREILSETNALIAELDTFRVRKKENPHFFCRKLFLSNTIATFINILQNRARECENIAQIQQDLRNIINASDDKLKRELNEIVTKLDNVQAVNLHK